MLPYWPAQTRSAGMFYINVYTGQHTRNRITAKIMSNISWCTRYVKGKGRVRLELVMD